VMMVMMILQNPEKTPAGLGILYSREIRSCLIVLMMLCVGSPMFTDALLAMVPYMPVPPDLAQNSTIPSSQPTDPVIHDRVAVGSQDQQMNVVLAPVHGGEPASQLSSGSTIHRTRLTATPASCRIDMAHASISGTPAVHSQAPCTPCLCLSH